MQSFSIVKSHLINTAIKPDLKSVEGFRNHLGMKVVSYCRQSCCWAVALNVKSNSIQTKHSEKMNNAKT